MRNKLDIKTHKIIRNFYIIYTNNMQVLFIFQINRFSQVVNITSDAINSNQEACNLAQK